MFHQHVHIRGSSTRVPSLDDAMALKRAGLAWIANHVDTAMHGQSIGEWIAGMGYSSPSRYVRHMSHTGVRGDAVTLVAMAHVLRANVVVFKHRQATARIKVQNATRTLAIGYYPEVHYVSTKTL